MDSSSRHPEKRDRAFSDFPALCMDQDTGRRKRKTPLIPQRDIRGDIIAVPLSFLACRTGNEVHSGGITRRAPGRTSHLPAAGPLSAGEGPSLFFGANATLPFTAPYKTVYYHLRPVVSRQEKNFGRGQVRLKLKISSTGRVVGTAGERMLVLNPLFLHIIDLFRMYGEEREALLSCRTGSTVGEEMDALPKQAKQI